MPYSNGATLRFLLPAPFRGNSQDCNLTAARHSQSSDSVYRDEADDVLGSITPLAYRPMINGAGIMAEIGADSEGEQNENFPRGIQRTKVKNLTMFVLVVRRTSL